MKKKILSVALIISLIAIAAMGTLAYFTDTKTAHNEISMGNVGIALHEIDETGAPFENPVNIMPGDTVVKQVTIENTGDNAVWVRVFVTLTLTNAEGEQIDVPDLITVTYNTVDWQYDDASGAWYYNAELAPNTATPMLISDVQFDTGMGNEYMNAKLAIDVTAQAVQTANNGETVMEAQGWSPAP